MAYTLTYKIKPDLSIVKIVMNNSKIDYGIKNVILEAYDCNRAI